MHIKTDRIKQKSAAIPPQLGYEPTIPIIQAAKNCVLCSVVGRAMAHQERGKEASNI
jgi:hypothetical protein